MVNLIGKVLFFVGTVVMPLVAMANGDPVMRYSSINRVALPEPLNVSEISIVNENVDITYSDGYNCFDVTYILKNKSDKDFTDLSYGFPIDYTVDDDSEIFHSRGEEYTESEEDVGWNDLLIKGVEFTLDEEPLRFSVSKESVRDIHYEDYENDPYEEGYLHSGVNRRWFYTELSIKPRTTVKLNVKYSVYACSFNGMYDSHLRYDFKRKIYSSFDEDYQADYYGAPFFSRYFTMVFKIIYDFTPAKHFGDGARYPLNVNINLSELKNPRAYLDGYCFYTDKISRYNYQSAKDFKPIDIEVRHEGDFSAGRIKRYVDRFAIGSDKFSVANNSNATTLEFTTPQFVSEVACSVDSDFITELECLITYADGHNRVIKYEKNEDGYADNQTRRLESTLLVVTEWADRLEEIVDEESKSVTFVSHDLDSDYCKIKKMTFTSPMTLHSIPLLSNIVPIDSRFK